MEDRRLEFRDHSDIQRFVKRDAIMIEICVNVGLYAENRRTTQTSQVDTDRPARGGFEEDGSSARKHIGA